jgi:hypothetical protein
MLKLLPRAERGKGDASNILSQLLVVPFILEWVNMVGTKIDILIYWLCF